MSDQLQRLFETIESRRGAAPTASHTAALFAQGRGAICNKVGEEATEVITAALSQSAAQVVAESADLLYHLAVLWADCGVAPGDVWAELAAREGRSGIAEKAARPAP